MLESKYRPTPTEATENVTSKSLFFASRNSRLRDATRTGTNGQEDEPSVWIWNATASSICELLKNTVRVFAGERSRLVESLVKMLKRVEKFIERRMKITAAALTHLVRAQPREI